MADRGGPTYGNDPGRQQWQGDGRPPRPRPYDYGVPNDDEYADAYNTPGSGDDWGSAPAAPDGYQEQQGNAYGANGHAANGYGADGYGTNGYAAEGYSPGGYETGGYGANNYSANGYGNDGYTADGYGNGNANGYEANAYEANGTGYGPNVNGNGNGYNAGYSAGGYGTNAPAANGYAGNGYAGNGYAGNGYNADGYHGNGYSPEGYSANGAGGNAGYSGNYDYSEPFEYLGPSAGQQGPQPPPQQVQQAQQAQQGPVQWAAQQPPAYGAVSSDTLWLGAAVRLPPEDDAHWLDESAGEAASAAAPTQDTASDIPLVGRKPGGRAERRRKAKRIKRRRRLSATKEVPILIGVALIIALVLKTFLVQAFVIPSGSMEATIRIGDRVLVDKLTPWFGNKPERGDVAVFKDPGGWLDKEESHQKPAPPGIKQGQEFLTFIGLLPSADEQDLIKRVIAVGGDRVKCCDRQGRVTVNGTPLHEPYLHPGNKPSEMSFDVHVPINRVFVMGDHRANSADSRYHLRDRGDGTVPEDNIVGRAVVIAWPFGHWKSLEQRQTFTSVPDAPGASSAAGDTGANRVAQLASPAELPLVMGVVGLSRLSGRRQWSVRSNRGGFGGRRSIRFWRRRGRWRGWPGRRST